MWALIPVKNLAIAKQRLKARLGPHREAFAKAMLADVLAAVADSRVIVGTVVVTADPVVADVAAKRGLTVVQEHGSEGLNAAIDQGVDAIRRMGVTRVVILPSDIPLLTGAELDRLIGVFEREAGKRDDNAIGISPAAEGGGTNFLVLNIRGAFTFQYGPDSYMIHSEHARLDRRGVIAMHSPTVSLDIDEPRQIGELLDFCARHPEFQKTRTWKFLQDTMRVDRETMKTRGI
jgi:2-phospho-L-lactate guanylyltransferase